MAPRSRKRIARLQRAAAISCCIAAAAAAASTSAAAAVNIPSHHVTPNNAPRRKVEKRRRLEQDYYRQLASLQKQQRQADNLGEADVANSHGDDGSRRLGASAGGIHKKGQEYAPLGVHQKGNKDSDDEDEKMNFVLMGSQSATTASTTAATESTPAPAQFNKNEQGENDGDDKPENLRLATNLRAFTRIGGSGGYTLPDSKRYPYMASLQLEGHSSDGTYDIHMCGGILVAPDLLLTAAHCAQYSPQGDNNKYQAFNGIEIGKADLSDEGASFDPYSLETFKLYYENLVPEKLHLHPDFNEETYEHDVMLVKVFGKSRFPPVKIGTGDVDTNSGVTVLGWGADSASSTQKYSNQLKAANMNLMSNNQCRNTDVEIKDPQSQITSVTSLEDHVFDDMMCATSNDRYICYGDAGGPAIAQGTNSDEDEVVGILSWGYGCVSSNYPAVMARVSDHYSWIRGIICSASSDPPEQYDCANRITALSGGAMQTVTLKLKLDKMALETGFVIEVRDTGEIMAQRQTGYYKSEGNEIVLENMDLPIGQCYRLIMLDSYGDGHCCDMGGGNSALYWGTDVGYYTGHKLAEVNANFEFYNGEEFCLTSPANSIQVVAKQPPPPSPPYVSAQNPPRTPRPTKRPTQPVRVPTPSTHLSGGSGFSGGNNDQASTWTGPDDDPAFEYCSLFCQDSSGEMCGNHACVVHTPAVATDDSSQAVVVSPAPTPPEEVAVPFTGMLTSNQFLEDSSEYFLTVQIQFDDKPEEVSWVLYDLTKNEVKVFVDFGEYPTAEFANKLLQLGVTMDGPEEGEKQYAFTLYDKGSDGLCCGHGDGYYKVYLGDVDDDLKLLGDDVFEFSSSYYFTLFEMEGLDAVLETPVPSMRPTKRPTRRPTRRPTQFPTKHPVQFFPAASPTTEKPTEPWEKQRSENVDDIGARWNTRTRTAPGVFNDVGGDQVKYKFNADGSIRNAAPRDSLARTSLVAWMVCSFVLAIML